MIRYVNNIDELIDIMDREFSSKNPVCPICKNKIGYVNIPYLELGIEELHFQQFKYPGIYCTEGHCIISVEENNDKNNLFLNKISYNNEYSECKLVVEENGNKLYEVIKLIKPFLDIEEGIDNMQLYWILINKDSLVSTRYISKNIAVELQKKLELLGAKAKLID